MSLDESYRIVLADDHALVRQGVRKILEERCDLEVVGEARDGLDLLNLLKVLKLSPHMVILDISMPNMSGIDAIRRVKELHPDIKVLVLTMRKSMDYVKYALTAGADGYILKEYADKVLFSTIERIRQGTGFVSPVFEAWE